MSKKKHTETVIPVFHLSQEKNDVALFPVKNQKLYLIKDNQILRRLYIRNFFFFFIRFKFVWKFYAFCFKRIRPIIEQLKRKDKEKSLMNRIFTLNKSKVKQLVGIKEK